MERLIDKMCVVSAIMIFSGGAMWSVLPKLLPMGSGGRGGQPTIVLWTQPLHHCHGQLRILPSIL